MANRRSTFQGEQTKRIRRVGLLALRTVVEVSVFGPLPFFSTGLRALWRGRLKERLGLMAPVFDAGLYLRQFQNPDRMKRAQRDPLLHYAMIGCFEIKAPCAAFDPVHYRAHAPGGVKASLQFPEALRRPASWRLWNASAEAADARRLMPSRNAGHAAGPRRSGAVLSMTHPRGGGSDRFLRFHEDRFAADGKRLLRLRPLHAQPRLMVLEDVSAGQPDATVSEGLPPASPETFAFPDDLDRLAQSCRQQGVERIVVNHVIDQPETIFDEINRLAATVGCPFEVLLHDYFAICPRVDLVDGSGWLCRGPEPDTCRSCVGQYGSQAGDVDPDRWRSRFASFLERAERTLCPSADHAERLSRSIPNVNFTVVPCEPPRELPDERWPGSPLDRDLRVATLGALNVPKGVRVVAALAGEAQRRQAPIEIRVIGPASDPARLSASGVHVSGAYREDDLPALIARAAPDVILLPAIWPETWSFVLTSALATGCPVICFDLGAPAERLRRLGRGVVLPLAMARQPDDLLEVLLAIRGGRQDPGQLGQSIACKTRHDQGAGFIDRAQR